MDNRPPSSQAEDETCQPSSSGYPLEVTVYEGIPGPSAPWAGCTSPPQRPGGKRKRSVAFRAEVEGDPAAEAQDTWVVEWLIGLKMKLKRQRVSSVLPEHHEVFNRMLEDPVVKKFLAWDKRLEVSDKYLLSMVIAYFSRAGLFSWQFQRIHFFIALYVASDMEEDNQAPKQAIFSFLYGKNRSQRPLFHKLRSQFIRSMGWKTRVTREECEQIQAFDPELWVWGRDRALLPQGPQEHAGLRLSACAKITEPRRDEDVQHEGTPDSDDSYPSKRIISEVRPPPSAGLDGSIERLPRRLAAYSGILKETFNAREQKCFGRTMTPGAHKSQGSPIRSSRPCPPARPIHLGEALKPSRSLSRGARGGLPEAPLSKGRRVHNRLQARRRNTYPVETS
ncbi:speedy protein E4-like [Lagenorhynchus albirostris]|uniref:speedy protein E4-like n=1 Tax=Lagenorhynchus albirostris TaxID=27610 RepID=UPI0028EE13F2|nr:speedy protein E4-like [Lagenorhynchus albirostris]